MAFNDLCLKKIPSHHTSPQNTPLPLAPKHFHQKSNSLTAARKDVLKRNFRKYSTVNSTRVPSQSSIGNRPKSVLATTHPKDDQLCVFESQISQPMIEINDQGSIQKQVTPDKSNSLRFKRASGSISTMLKNSCMSQPKSVEKRTYQTHINKFVHPSLVIPSHLTQEQCAKHLQGLEVDFRAKEFIETFDDFVCKKLISFDNQSRIQKFNQFVQERRPANDPNEDESTIAEQMFFDDLKQLRRMVHNQLVKHMNAKLQVEDDFRTRICYFMEEIKKYKAAYDVQDEKIQKLERLIQNEQEHSRKINVDNEVEQMCQRAYFTYELLAQTKDAENKYTIKNALLQRTRLHLLQEENLELMKKLTQLEYQIKDKDQQSKEMRQVMEKKFGFNAIDLSNQKRENEQMKSQICKQEVLIEKYQKEILALTKEHQQYKINQIEIRRIYEKKIEQSVSPKKHTALLNKHETVNVDLFLQKHKNEVLQIQDSSRVAELNQTQILMQQAVNQMCNQFKKFEEQIIKKSLRLQHKVEQGNMILKKFARNSKPIHFAREISIAKTNYDQLEFSYKALTRIFQKYIKFESLTVEEKVLVQPPNFKNYSGHIARSISRAETSQKSRKISILKGQKVETENSPYKKKNTLQILVPRKELQVFTEETRRDKDFEQIKLAEPREKKKTLEKQNSFASNISDYLVEMYNNQWQLRETDHLVIPNSDDTVQLSLTESNFIKQGMTEQQLSDRYHRTDSSPESSFGQENLIAAIQQKKKQIKDETDLKIEREMISNDLARALMQQQK